MDLDIKNTPHDAQERYSDDKTIPSTAAPPAVAASNTDASNVAPRNDAASNLSHRTASPLPPTINHLAVAEEAVGLAGGRKGVLDD